MDGSRYSEVVWSFLSHTSSVHQFRVILAGSQPCASYNAAWFVCGENNTGIPSECRVQEIGNENSKTCVLTCRCADPCACGYLHYRVQFPPWVTTTLALCHSEVVPQPGIVNPELIIYWFIWARIFHATYTGPWIIMNVTPRYAQWTLMYVYNQIMISTSGPLCLNPVDCISYTKVVQSMPLFVYLILSLFYKFSFSVNEIISVTPKTTQHQSMLNTEHRFVHAHIHTRAYTDTRARK